MKQLFILTILATTLMLGCRKSDIGNGGDGSEILLGVVTDGAGTKAVQPLAKGYQFRLYVFKQGVTDISKLITSRTYTISDEAGTPVLDAGQEPLRLSMDAYDTYIVGPLRGSDALGLPADIATVDGVNCYIGNDIVSSYTSLNVVNGVNTLNPASLSHRMSKVGYVIQRPSSATYTKLNVLTVEVANQPKGGIFEFNASGGSITTGTETASRFMSVEALSVDSTRFYAEDYFFPQPSGDMRIAATYYATTAAEGEKMYEQSGWITVTLGAGEHHRFTSDLLVPNILLWRLKLLPWSDKNFGGVTAYNGLLLELCGMDAPITIDGVQYWPDRSGNGNHVKLVGSNVKYNAAQRYYYTTSNSGHYLQVPSFGKQGNLLIEVAARSKAGIQSKVVSSSGNVNVGLPYNNNDVVLDWGPDAAQDRISVSYMPSDVKAMEGVSTWQFSRRVNSSDVTSEIYRNGVLLKSGAIRSRDMDLGVMNLLEGNSSSVKLHGVRVYNRLLSAGDLAKNSNSDRELYEDASGARVVVSPSMRIEIPNAGGKYSVRLISNYPWKVSSVMSGVVVSPSSGDVTTGSNVEIIIPSKSALGQAYMPVVFETVNEGRKGSATWTGVREASLAVSPLSQSVSGQGATLTVRLTTNMSWEASSTISGVVISPSSGDAMTNGAISITVPKNLDSKNSRVVPVLFRTTNLGTQIEGLWEGEQAKGSGLGGNFAGKLVSSSDVEGTWYYYDKWMEVAEADEGSFVWGPDGVTGVTNKMDGKGNTLALKNLGTGYGAATACWNKTTGSVPAGTWYLPAQNQLMAMWILKPSLASFANDDYWSSTENDSYYSWNVYFNVGSTGINPKSSTSVRCIREN